MGVSTEDSLHPLPPKNKEKERKHTTLHSGESKRLPRGLGHGFFSEFWVVALMLFAAVVCVQGEQSTEKSAEGLPR